MKRILVTQTSMPPYEEYIEEPVEVLSIDEKVEEIVHFPNNHFAGI